MNTLDAKRVLETALICFEPAAAAARDARAVRRRIGADTLRDAARRTGARLARTAAIELVDAGQRLALPEPARDARVPRPAAPREAAALFARGAGDAGDHRLPPAGDARRHRGHPRRHGQPARSSSSSRTAAGSRRSAIARRRAGRRCYATTRQFLDDLGLATLDQLPRSTAPAASRPPLTPRSAGRRERKPLARSPRPTADAAPSRADAPCRRRCPEPRLNAPARPSAASTRRADADGAVAARRRRRRPAPRRRRKPGRIRRRRPRRRGGNAGCRQCPAEVEQPPVDGRAPSAAPRRCRRTRRRAGAADGGDGASAARGDDGDEAGSSGRAPAQPAPASAAGGATGATGAAATAARAASDGEPAAPARCRCRRISKAPLPRHSSRCRRPRRAEVFAQVLSGEFDADRRSAGREPKSREQARPRRPSPTRPSCTRCWRRPASARAATWRS